jgi:WD40 repeat protein
MSLILTGCYEITNPPAYNLAWQHTGSMVAVGGRGIELFSTQMQKFKTLTGDSVNSIQVAWNSKTGDLVTAGCVMNLWRFPGEKPYRTVNIYEQQHTCAGAVVWIAEENKLVTGTPEGQVIIWDVDTLTVLTIIDAHDDQINSMLWDDNHNYLITASSDKNIGVWDITTGSKVDYFSTGIPVYTMSLNMSGDKLIIGGSDTSIQIWDLIDRRLLQTLEVAKTDLWVESVAFSPNDAFIAAASADKITIWNAKTGDLQRTLTGHNGSIHEIAWHPTGKYIASAGADNTLRLWEIDTEKVVITSLTP